MSMSNPGCTIQSNAGTWFFSTENGAFKLAAKQNLNPTSQFLALNLTVKYVKN